MFLGWGIRVRVWGWRFSLNVRVFGSGFGGWGFHCRVRIWGLEFLVWGLGVGVLGLGFGGWGFRVEFLGGKLEKR